MLHPIKRCAQMTQVRIYKLKQLCKTIKHDMLYVNLNIVKLYFIIVEMTSHENVILKWN